MIRLIFTALLLFVTTFSFGQENDSYKKTLRKMMQVSGAETSYKTALNQMVSIFKTQQSNASNEFWEEFMTEANRDAIDQLIHLIVPIYQKHLTEADLLKMIAFYETPIGKKFAEKTPFITQEAMLAGQQWGKQMTERIVSKLKEKGYSKE